MSTQCTLIADCGKDGKLEVRLFAGVRRYRLRNIIDVWLEREKKRARIAGNRAPVEAKSESRLAKTAAMQSDMALSA